MGNTTVAPASQLTTPPRAFTPAPSPLLQRACACGQHAGNGGECESCRQKWLGLQRQAASQTTPDVAPPIVHDVLRSSGQPLDASTRAFMEPRFDHDFSGVRVHTDAKAAESARAVNALAYTVGRDVVFGAGQYAPRASAGRRLLAHELTHVVQQSGHIVRPDATVSVHPSNTFLEREATHVANSLAYINPETMSQPEQLTQRALHAGPRDMIGASLEPIAMIQRQEMCEPQGEPRSQSAADVIYDYENQVCRPPEADEVAASVPEADPVDGEFWIWPSRLREGAKPIFDDEDTSVIVGFRYSSGGYYEIYDLEGNMVESGEPGLESPLIDPIDILAGGITGLGRGLIRGGGRAVARGIAGGAGRGGGAALARAGLVVTIKVLGRGAITAVRGVYRAIRFRGVLNFTGTTIARMADPARRVPIHILKLAIRFGTRTPDPQGVAGAFRYVIPMIRNGRQYSLEVVIREADNTILHFLYR